MGKADADGLRAVKSLNNTKRGDILVRIPAHLLVELGSGAASSEVSLTSSLDVASYKSQSRRLVILRNIAPRARSEERVWPKKPPFTFSTTTYAN